MPKTEATRFCMLVCLLGATATHAEQLHLCVSDVPIPPLTFPDHDGVAQSAIRHASSLLGVSVQFTVQPWRRCVSEVYAGKQDGAIMAFADVHRPFVSFPMKGGSADESLRLATIKVVAVRRVGDPVSWDGVGFSGLTGDVLYSSGLATTGERLERLGISAFDSAKGNEQMLRMLMLDRAQLAVMRENEAKQLLRANDFKHALEILPTPIIQFSVFLGFNKSFHARNEVLVKKLWPILVKAANNQ